MEKKSYIFVFIKYVYIDQISCFGLGSHGQALRQRRQDSWISIWVDCHSSFHVDGHCSNGYLSLSFQIYVSYWQSSRVLLINKAQFQFQWTNLLNPDNIKGLSAVSMLLAMIGNGLMIPRSLFIRDFMWYVCSP